MTKTQTAVDFVKKHGILTTRWLFQYMNCNSPHDICAKTRDKLASEGIDYNLVWVKNPRTNTRFKVLFTKPKIFNCYLKEEGLVRV